MKALTTILALFGTLACCLIAGAAYAQSTINDCEKIQAADAYNQCLAKFGPPMKSGNLEPERPGDIKSSSAEAAATGGGKPSRGGKHSVGRRHGRGSYARRSRGSHGGRKHMSISVGK